MVGIEHGAIQLAAGRHGDGERRRRGEKKPEGRGRATEDSILNFELRMANFEFKGRELDPECLLLATLSKKAGAGPALLDSDF